MTVTPFAVGSWTCESWWPYPKNCIKVTMTRCIVFIFEDIKGNFPKKGTNFIPKLLSQNAMCRWFHHTLGFRKLYHLLNILQSPIVQEHTWQLAANTHSYVGTRCTTVYCFVEPELVLWILVSIGWFKIAVRRRRWTRHI